VVVVSDEIFVIIIIGHALLLPRAAEWRRSASWIIWLDGWIKIQLIIIHLLWASDPNLAQQAQLHVGSS
jgi:hypothetical protein